MLDLLTVEHIPTWAAHALAHEHDSPALRELAGLEHADPRQVRETFEAVLEELGVPAPSQEQAR